MPGKYGHLRGPIDRCLGCLCKRLSLVPYLYLDTLMPEHQNDSYCLIYIGYPCPLGSTGEEIPTSQTQVRDTNRLSKIHT